MLANSWFCAAWKQDGVPQNGMYTSNFSKFVGAAKIVEALSKLEDLDVCMILDEAKIVADKAKAIFPGTELPAWESCRNECSN